MDVSLLEKLLYDLSHENYNRTFSAYRSQIELGAAHGGTSKDILYNGIVRSTKPDLLQASNNELMQSDTRLDWINPFVGLSMGNKKLGLIDAFSGNLLHDNVQLLLRFVSDAEQDPVLSTYAIGLHDRLCRESLGKFFQRNLDYVPGPQSTRPTSHELCEFYTGVNLIAHWVNLGCVQLEDVQDRILQSLTSQPTVYPHQINSLMILLKISGATFATYVDPLAIDHCCDLLNSSDLKDLSWDGLPGRPVAIGLAEVVLRLRIRGWAGLPPPPILHSAKSEASVPEPQDPAATPVAISLGLPGITEQSQTPTLPSSIPAIPPGESPKSSAPPSPSASISALSDFTIPDSLDDAIAELETTIPHDTFYLDDGSVEVVCGKTLFRVHAGALSFHSPALRQMFSSSNLTAAESPNGCPRIVSSDTPGDFATLLKVVYLPEFPDRSKVPDFSTFSSLLRVSTSYEMQNLRARLLETINGAYPETPEGVDPSKALGEKVFDAPEPHPNAVLNFFVQQKVTSALPMAYYMAVRKGLDSLMDTQLPPSAVLSGQTLRFAIRGLIALREMELKEAHRIVFTIRDASNGVDCSSTDCPSQGSKGLSDTGTVGAYQRAFDLITGPAVGGVRVLRVLSANRFAEDPESKFCRVCAERMEVAHAEVRKKAWAALPEVFGLKM